MSDFIPSKYQSKVFETVEKIMNREISQRNVIIEAVAGSGKTKTIIETLKRVNGSAIFLAFNKSIAMELATKVPATCSTSTLHSAGFSMIKQSGINPIVDQFKLDKIMDNYQPTATSKYMKSDERAVKTIIRNAVKKLVGLVKNTLIDYNDASAMYELADYYGIDMEANYLPYVKYVMEKSNEISDKMIDFDDMIYLPVFRKITSKTTYNWVFVDETQDMNVCQIELILKLVSAEGSIVCVGDTKQSIYGFRGADVGAMARVSEVLNAVELPLSICYRCPSSHIELAKAIVPQIEAREGAPVGEIATIEEEKFFETLTNENASKTLVLSRTNASLVSYALKLIAGGQKAIIKGRDIGKGLISLVKKFNKAEM